MLIFGSSSTTACCMHNKNSSNTQLFLFQDESVARQLVELGYKGNGEAVRREDFMARKVIAEAQRNVVVLTGPKPFFKDLANIKSSPLIDALARYYITMRDIKL